MIAVIFLILSLLWVIAGIVIVVKNIYSCDDMMGLGIIMIISVIAITAFSPIMHINDLALIRNQQLVIDVYEQAIMRVNEELSELPSATSLMNADSPARTLIETKSQYVKDLTQKKAEIVEAQLNIERRKMGTGAWAVWIWGGE